MFQDDYKATFSQVTASEETYRRVLNMAKQKKTRSWKGTAGKILIAAAIMSALVVTASAAELGWFQRYFERQSGEPLNQAQIEYIESNAQAPEDMMTQDSQENRQAQTQDGYTLQVKSAITDGQMVYITIGVTGPEDAVLSKTVIEGYDPAAPSLYAKSFLEPGFFTCNGEEFMGYTSFGQVEDGDGLDNTQDLIFTATADDMDGEKPFASGKVWKMHIEDLVARYQNEAYAKELNEKYKGQSNFFYTEEEGKRLNPEVTLAQGVWDFEFCFADSDVRTVELVKTPVTAKAGVGMKVNGSNVYEEITVTSFQLSALSAVIYADYDAGSPDFDYGGEGEQVAAVLKDGSRIHLRSRMGVPGQQRLEAVQPIPLDQVQYVVLADGTQLPMP